MVRHLFRPRSTLALAAALCLSSLTAVAANAANAAAVTSAAATTTAPAVTNPGFESGGTGTATPAGWTASGTTSASYTQSGGRSGSFELSHYSASAYTVDTYQELTNITAGYYTFGVWVRSDDTGGSNWITMSSCGGSTPKTYIPVDSDGAWVHIVAYTYVSSSTCYIDFHSASAAGAWTTTRACTDHPDAATSRSTRSVRSSGGSTGVKRPPPGVRSSRPSARSTVQRSSRGSRTTTYQRRCQLTRR